MSDLSKRIVYKAPGMENATVERNIVYRRDGETELLMDVYTPPGLSDGTRLPAVFFVHGGPIAPDMQPPKEWGVYLSYGELAAASGLVGVTFNHRFYHPQTVEQAASDVCAAIAYVREHADRFHVDAERLCLWAFSGGGPLLSLAFWERPAHIKCIVAFYALLDLRHVPSPGPDDPTGEVRVQKFSTAAYLKDKAAGLPMFVARAGLDSPLINQSVDTFVQKALAANTLITVMNHPQGQHGFDILDDNERSREIIAHAIEFVKQHMRNTKD